MFAAQMPVSADSLIVKYRYREERASGVVTSLGTLTGFSAAAINVPARGVGAAQREHIRVSVPDGAAITRARLRLDEREVPAAKYGLRQSPQRAVVYTYGLDKGEYDIVVRMRPRTGPFFVPALGTVIFMALLMAAGWFLEASSARFSINAQNADAAVAIIALVPSVMAAYFSRVGEHRLVGRLLIMPRLLLLLAGLAAVAVAAAVAAEMSHEHIQLAFAVAFWVATGLAVYFGGVVITAAVALAWAGRKTPSFPE